MFDVITFGSATLDIFFRSKNFEVLREKKFITDKGLCVPFGSKVKVDDTHFSSGGGGTNVAASFANQGLKTAFCGMIGKDAAGETIAKELEKFGIRRNFLFRSQRKPTDISVILNSGKGNRTILVYHGASSELRKTEIPWERLRAKWFYLAPFSGKLCRLFEPVLKFAKKIKAKVAVNPSEDQLSLSNRKWEKILKNVDVLILNQQEASILTKVPYQNEKRIFEKLNRMSPGIAIMTRGDRGVVVSDGNCILKAPALKTRLVAETGAGDAFGSGFLSGLIKKGDIKYAIQMGTANAAGCLKEIGAKYGLLKANQSFRKVKVKILC